MCLQSTSKDRTLKEEEEEEETRRKGKEGKKALKKYFCLSLK